MCAEGRPRNSLFTAVSKLCVKNYPLKEKKNLLHVHSCVLSLSFSWERHISSHPAPNLNRTKDQFNPFWDNISDILCPDNRPSLVWGPHSMVVLHSSKEPVLSLRNQTDMDPSTEPLPDPTHRDHCGTPPSITAPRKPIRLQERRGSNVSLVLDVSSLGTVEPLCSISTPKETILHLLRTSTRPLTACQLQEASGLAKALDNEYQKIPPNFVNSSELDIPGHALKDRYKTILPNPETRVCLQTPGAEEKADGYINANYIRGYGGAVKCYIATQGPMVNTVRDFWEMVWQEESSVIVMITDLKEKKEKCVLYWPEKEGQFGRFHVRVTAVTECEGYTIRDLSLQLGSESRQVRHYWYSSWLDHQTPDCGEPLLRLLWDVQHKREALTHPGPTVVHCSAGIGRTGCFIASSIGCQQLQHTGEVDVLGIVCQLRLDRGGMIQTTEQYQFLYLTLALYSRQLSQSHHGDRGRSNTCQTDRRAQEDHHIPATTAPLQDP